MIGRQNSIPVQDQPASSFRESRARTLIVKVGLLLFFVVVALRLVQIQVIDAAKYREKAERQYESRVDLPALRGKIVDRNQRQLVTNMMFVSFAADPKIIGDRASELAERFAQVFDKPKSQYLEKINLETRRFVYLERRVSPQYEKRINAASFEGLVVKDEPRRHYQYDHVAGQLLGFTDDDNKGLSGIELQLDTLLRGRNGYVIMQRDAIGRRRPSVDYPRIEPINGNTAELTIDIEYQAIAEEELRKGVERNKAESGLAIMLDPATGEVLAMANYPSINPGDPASAGPAAARNRVVTDMFEPGSTFKLVTAAAALERHLVQPDQKFNAEQGEYVVRLPNGKVRNKITDTHKYNVLTFREAIEFSSNIVMAKVSDIVGAEALYTTARNFGFGTECGIELPGEIRGELKKPTQWSGTTLNAMAYGYEVGVTPLQIATAYAAVANGGVLMKPFIVRQIVSPEGEVLHVTRPEVVRRVVSQATAHTLTQFLRGVVERGTGTLAAMKGIPLAGKTGTARKFADGRYIEGSYIASFVGFFPADNPAVVCLVMLDNPNDHSYVGGLVSAPIFKAIAEKVYAVSPRFARTQAVAGNAAVVPDVVTVKLDAAKELLVAQGFEVTTEGNGTVVMHQSPAAGTKERRGTTVTLSTASAPAAVKGYTDVPDLRGLPIRRAVNRLSLQHLDAAVSGSGIVASQFPAPGELVKTGTRIALRCEPRALTMVTLY